MFFLLVTTTENPESLSSFFYNSGNAKLYEGEQRLDGEVVYSEESLNKSIKERLKNMLGEEDLEELQLEKHYNFELRVCAGQVRDFWAITRHEHPVVSINVGVPSISFTGLKAKYIAECIGRGLYTPLLVSWVPARIIDFFITGCDSGPCARAVARPSLFELDTLEKEYTDLAIQEIRKSMNSVQTEIKRRKNVIAYFLNADSADYERPGLERQYMNRKRQLLETAPNVCVEIEKAFGDMYKSQEGSYTATNAINFLRRVVPHYPVRRKNFSYEGFASLGDYVFNQNPIFRYLSDATRASLQEVLRRMSVQNSNKAFFFYGETRCLKTTIAYLIVETLGLPYNDDLCVLNNRSIELLKSHAGGTSRGMQDAKSGWVFDTLVAKREGQQETFLNPVAIFDEAFFRSTIADETVRFFNDFLEKPFTCEYLGRSAVDIKDMTKIFISNQKYDTLPDELKGRLYPVHFDGPISYDFLLPKLEEFAVEKNCQFDQQELKGLLELALFDLNQKGRKVNVYSVQTATERLIQDKDQVTKLRQLQEVEIAERRRTVERQNLASRFRDAAVMSAQQPIKNSECSCVVQ
ncbi:MAG: hypothetical protein H6850_02370 [Alphaproteobacteria bacterium]|nr:MAG: hypothetical protein H6850_02370 [Alphaproteobacteria bacterium]